MPMDKKNEPVSFLASNETAKTIFARFASAPPGSGPPRSYPKTEPPPGGEPTIARGIHRTAELHQIPGRPRIHWS
jgi:hypothetical protein